MKKICWLFLILSLCINMISIDIYLPAMSGMAIELSTSPFMLKLIFIINFIELSIAPLIWGAFSDIKGRKAAIFSCLTLSLVGQFLAGLSPNVYFLMLFRVIQYLGAGALSSIILTLICDYFEGQNRAKAIALFEMALPFAMAFGPLLGAILLQHLEWRGSFSLFAGIQVFCFLGVGLSLPKMAKIKKVIKIEDAIKGLSNFFRDLVNMKIVFILGLAEGLWMIFTISSAFFYLKTFNISLFYYGFYQSAPILFFLLGLVIYRFLIQKIDILNLFKIGLFGYIFFGMGFLFLRSGIVAPTPLILSSLISIMTLFCGFIGPSGNAFVLNRVDQNLMGTSAASIASLINLIVGGAMLCGSYLTGAELSINFFDTLLGIIVLVAILWFTLRKLNTKEA